MSVPTDVSVGEEAPAAVGASEEEEEEEERLAIAGTPEEEEEEEGLTTNDGCTDGDAVGKPACPAKRLASR